VPRNQAHELSLPAVIGSAFARKIPTRIGVKTLEVQLVATVLTDRRIDKLSLN
jgi:hypothetical protein